MGSAGLRHSNAWLYGAGLAALGAVAAASYREWLGAAAAAAGAGATLAAHTVLREARLRVGGLEAEAERLRIEAAGREAASSERESRALAVEDRARAVEARKAEVDRAIDEVSRIQRQVVQSEKLASLGRMAAGVAHEFNNPAQHLIVNLPYLRRGIDRLRRVLDVALVSPPADPAQAAKLQRAVDEAKLARTNADLDEILEGLEEGATRIGELVRDLTTFSRLDTADVKEVDIHEGLDATLRLLGYRFKDRIEIHRDYQKLPALRCHAGQINHVLMNVLSNAADAISGKGNLWVKTEPAGRDRVRIRITDDGSGMSAETLAKVFDPFFTTKPVGAGTGLGQQSVFLARRHLVLPSYPRAGCPT